MVLADGPENKRNGNMGKWGAFDGEDGLHGSPRRTGKQEERKYGRPSDGIFGKSAWFTLRLCTGTANTGLADFMLAPRQQSGRRPQAFPDSSSSSAASWAVLLLLFVEISIQVCSPSST
ncbi:hypothetical protein NDU88_005646 [Pleurodeles waltl]|uniref:Uncharacterized protein n=1 Tax=Pleurodeles waltl TaxID=8319 RepID=A0AAV7TVD9_PLEWA|nr:hypothetical protein NDU88_005646 [Pleurodeles waltl]